MVTKRRLLSRNMVAGIAAGLLLLSVAASAKAQSSALGTSPNPIDEINKLAGSASGGAAAPQIPSPGTAPLTKLSGVGRVSETLGAGGCTNNPLTASCSSSNCDNVTMTGPVNVSGFGKGNLNACLTILLNSSAGACLDGLGIGSLTNSSGKKSINLSFGGHFCLADEVPGTSTVTFYYSTDATYVIEGGTGPYATETGAGSMNVSDIFVASGSSTPPIPGAGQIALTGSMSKN